MSDLPKKDPPPSQMGKTVTGDDMQTFLDVNSYLVCSTEKKPLNRLVITSRDFSNKSHMEI